MSTWERQRERMVSQQLERRGIRSAAVLDAMRTVPREVFLPEGLEEFAYEDSALPIAEEQTISQPYIVALTVEALEPRAGARALDVGTGSGYAAAVLSRIVGEVYTIERHRSLAETAERRFRELGYDNIHVRVGDGTLGWPEAAPFDCIAVAAGGPRVPPALKEQLASGGRIVIPVGPTVRDQVLVRVRRTNGGFEEEDLGAVRFVPLIGEEGWADPSAPRSNPGHPGGGRRSGPGAAAPERAGASVPHRIRAAAERFESIEEADLGGLLDRIGDARVVLLGEATHGTSEFYGMRARITRELVERKGFRIVAIEADWPDAARLDAHVRGYEPAQPELTPFTRFPTWMWANEEFRGLVDWLRERNEGMPAEERAGLFGLDLYSLHTSLEAVLDYLDDVDPDAAAVARHRYGCLTPWSADPTSYGRAVIAGRYRECEDDVVATLADLLTSRLRYAREDGQRFLNAEQNARLVANAERYYRVMYYGSRESWNLRDRHMFETLENLLEHHGPDARAVVWEHNSHLGDAAFTEMGARGEINVGHLARQRFGDDAYLVGFGTHTGTVAAAHDWGQPMEVMDVRPSHEKSYERLCHDSELDRFLLPLRAGHDDALRRALLDERLERAIGVIYRPRTELQSHYFHAVLPRQFDEYVWFDETRAVTPIGREQEPGPPETYPFAV